MFVQDAWTVNNRLTINAGLRTERERVPTYTTQADVPDFGIEFGFKDKLAPRIGSAYDLKGDGRSKVFGSWGVFYDIFKARAAARLVRRRQVARVPTTRSTPTTGPNLVDACELPAGMPGHAAERSG